MKELLKKYLNYLTVLFLIIVFFTLNYILFYNQCTSALLDSDMFLSDMLMYMFKAVGSDVPYDFPYPVFFKFISLLKNCFTIENATAIATAVLNTGSMLILCFFMKKHLQCSAAKALFISFCLHYVSMIFLPFSLKNAGLPLRYLGVFSPNPWHNATYIATRPFSVAAFFLFAEILEKDKTSIRDHVLFGIFMLLTTMTKPSFTLPMMAVCFIAWITDFFKWHIKDRKKRTMLLIIVLLPTIIDLLYQYRSVFTSEGAESDKGIGMGLFTAWGYYCGNIPLAIILGILCPLYLLIRYKEKKRIYLLSWLLYLVAFLTFALLYEKGDRITHLNFGWGYMHGMFFLFCTSAIQIFGRTKITKHNIPDYIFFGMHLLCGLIYFYYLYTGGGFRYF